MTLCNVKLRTIATLANWNICAYFEMDRQHNYVLFQVIIYLYSLLSNEGNWQKLQYVSRNQKKMIDKATDTMYNVLRMSIMRNKQELSKQNRIEFFNQILNLDHIFFLFWGETIYVSAQVAIKRTKCLKIHSWIRNLPYNIFFYSH